MYHASEFFLSRLDRVQADFLLEIGLNEEQALFDHQLAPLADCRDIAMLGSIHRVVLGEAPVQLKRFFRPSTQTPFPCNLRNANFGRCFELHDPIKSFSSSSLKRSALSLIYPYNLLPQSVVDSKSVSIF